MRTGIVGLGLRAGNVLKMIKEDMPEMELVGYVDPDPCGISIIEKEKSSRWSIDRASLEQIPGNCSDQCKGKLNIWLLPGQKFP